MPHVDGDLLALAGLHLVDVGDRDAHPGEDRRRRLPDPEARRKNGIVPGDRDFAGLGQAAAAEGHDFLESGIHLMDRCIGRTCGIIQ